MHSRSAMDEAITPHHLQISLPIPGIDASPRCQHAGDGIQSPNFDARQNQVRFRLASSPTDSPEPRVSGRGVFMTTQLAASTGAGRTEARKPECRRVRSAEYKANNAKREKQRRADLKAKGLCKGCMQPVSPGHSHCDRCLAAQRERWDDLKRRGLCKKCKVAVSTGLVHCDECLAAMRAARSARKQQLLDDLMQTAQTAGPSQSPSETLDKDSTARFDSPNACTYNESQQNGTAGRCEHPAMPGPLESEGLLRPGGSVKRPTAVIKPCNCVLRPHDGSAQCRLSGESFDLGGMVLMIVEPRYPTVAPWPGPDDGDEGRTDRGWHIAAGTPFVKVPGGWLTPSQSDPSVHYRLAMDEDGSHCSCPDQVASCKHIRGLEFVLEREQRAQEMIASIPAAQSMRDQAPQGRNQKPPHQDGNHGGSATAGTPPMDLDAPIREVRERSPRGPDSPARKRVAPGTEDRKRPTYQQDWPVYNAAQRNEKYHFRHLLRDLAALVEEPVHQRGRRPYSYAAQIFGLVYREYVGKSWRKFDTDLREACHNGIIDAAPSTSALARYMDDQALTPILHDLVLCSALPMKGYETKFAIDATGFSSNRFARWFSEKWGQVKEHQARDWAKLHLICGTETQIITCAEVSDWRDHDNRYFAPLVAETAEYFDVHQVAADKAYTSRRNMVQVDGLGAALFAPFKSNVVAPHFADDSAWARMLRKFLTDYDRWADEYHARSNVESAISKLKRLFGDELASRKVVAQCNELLCRVIAHNLVIVIYQMYERGLVTEFYDPELMNAA